MAKTSKLCSGIFSKAHQRFSQRGRLHRALWLALQLTVFAAWQLSGVGQASWQAVTVPGLAAGANFSRLWTRAPGEVYVWAYSGPVGSVESTLYRLYQEQWQPVLQVSGEYPASVFGTGASEVFAATQTQLWRSTDKGDTWTLQTVPGSGDFWKISGTPNNVHVVRQGRGIVRFDGSQWQQVFNDSVNPVYTLTVLGPAEGYYVTCWGWGTWNGSQWQYHAQGFDFCDIYDTWAMRDAQGLHWWAVGNNNFANGIRVWCWDAASGTFGSKYGYCFSDGSGYNVGSAYNVWGSSASDVYVTGDLGTTSGGARGGRVYHFDGSAWTWLTELDLLPRGMWGTGPDDVWIAGEEGKLFHRTIEATEPLTIVCPENITTDTAPGQCSQVVDFVVSATGDSPVVVCDPPSGSEFSKGTTTVNCFATDVAGNVATCSFTVTVNDTEAPVIACPADILLPCGTEQLMPATFAAAATDNCDPVPVVTYSIPSGSGFPVGVTTVTATAMDASGNFSQCEFTVSRAALGFTGFLSPIGGADGTGGSFADPVRSFKMGSTIPVKFTASCDGTPVVEGIHTLQAIKWSDQTDVDPPIDATPTDGATAGNQFRLADGEWHFNLDTKATGMSAGKWQLIATLSDCSQHNVWIQIK